MSPRSLTRRARQAVRLVLAAGWTAVCYAVWVLPALLLLLFPSALQRWNGWGTMIWSRGLLRVIGFRVEVIGHPPVKPFFLVANHLSYVDILVLGSRLGGTFVSKHELAGWPVLGHLARVTGTIFINREVRRDAVRVLEAIDRAMARGGGVILFAEGTSSRGDKVYPLRPALLEWAARRQFPVHVATLAYRTDDPAAPAEQAVCWWGDMTFTPHLLNLLTLGRVDVRLQFVGDPVTEPDRSRLAGRLHGALADAFIPSNG